MTKALENPVEGRFSRAFCSFKENLTDDKFTTVMVASYLQKDNVFADKIQNQIKCRALREKL